MLRSPTGWMSAVVILSCTGCAGLPAPPALPGGSSAAVVAPGLTRDELPQQRVRPGDVLTVELVSLPPRTFDDVTVDARGTVHLPGVGDVLIAGSTLTEAEARLTQAVRALDRLAIVHARVTSPAGQRVTVLGAVQSQGSIVLVPGMRVSEVLAKAGGPLMVHSPAGGPPVPLADLAHALVVREGRPLPVSVPLALAGNRAHDVHVHAGDHLYVPRAWDSSVTISGQVAEPQVLPHFDGLRLSQSLAAAGGISVNGDRSDVRLVRGEVDSARAYSADFAAITEGRAHDVVLARGDVVYVTDDPVEDLGEVLNVVAPFVTLASTYLFIITLGLN